MIRIALIAAVGATAILVGAGEGPAAPNCPNLGYACATVSVGIDASPPGSSAGTGRVTSEPPGIDCSVVLGVASGVCTYTFEWPAPQNPPPTLTVTLKAVPAPDSRACRASSPNCATVSSATTFPVSNGGTHEQRWEFRLYRQPVTVTRTGIGTGRVLSSPSGIDCGAVCAAWLDYGASVTLTAAPDAGAEFRGWTGACAGQGAACSLAMTSPRVTNAVFELKAPAGPTPAPNPPSAPLPQPQPQPQPQPKPDAKVDAEVLGHKLGRSGLGFRLVRIELELDERVAATSTLTRGGKALVTKRATLGPGRRILTLVVPQRIAKGRARIQLHLLDADGNTRSWSRSVLIGRAK